MHTPELSSLENNQNKSHVVTAAVPSEFSQDWRNLQMRTNVLRFAITFILNVTTNL